MKSFELRRHADAIPLGVNADGNPTFRVGKRSTWLMVPLRVPNRLAKMLAAVMGRGGK